MISGKATTSNSSLEEILSLRKAQEEEVKKDVLVIPDPDSVTGAASTAPSLADPWKSLEARIVFLEKENMDLRKSWEWNNAKLMNLEVSSDVIDFTAIIFICITFSKNPIIVSHRN